MLFETNSRRENPSGPRSLRMQARADTNRNECRRECVEEAEAVLSTIKQFQTAGGGRLRDYDYPTLLSEGVRAKIQIQIQFCAAGAFVRGEVGSSKRGHPKCQEY